MGRPEPQLHVRLEGARAAWPASGPKKLWPAPSARDTPPSSSTAAASTPCTGPRPGVGCGAAPKKSIAALDADTGVTIWEHKFPSSTEGVNFSEGAGPHSTPLVTADRVFAVGSRKEVFALNKANGQVAWSHDMIKEYGATGPDRGYACSPLLYDDMIIVTVGGPGQAIAAFNHRPARWSGRPATSSSLPPRPIIIDVDGQKQLLYFAGESIVGLDPASGKTLWTHPHKTDWGLNISTPIWSPSDHLLFVSSAYGTGSRVLELRQAGGKTTATEKWFNNRMRIHIGTAIRDRLARLRIERRFRARVHFRGRDRDRQGGRGRTARSRARSCSMPTASSIILDEDGNLGLATVSPSGLQVLAKAPVLDNLAWTPPTLVGTKLYVRDRKNVIALELGGIVTIPNFQTATPNQLPTPKRLNALLHAVGSWTFGSSCPRYLRSGRGRWSAGMNWRSTSPRTSSRRSRMPASSAMSAIACISSSCGVSIR